MDINKILIELRAEREEIEKAIISLVRLSGKQRGRHPKLMKAIEERTKTPAPKKKLL